jgi:hypothetical protein
MKHYSSLNWTPVFGFINRVQRLFILLTGVAFFLTGCAKKDESFKASGFSADVIVFGATPSGIAAAIAASREGGEVLLIEELNRVGGMYTAGGMGLTDSFFMDRRMLSGIYDEIHNRIDAYYKAQGIRYRSDNYKDAFPRGAGRWYHEPSVAEKIFNEMIEESGIEVLLGQHLISVEKAGRRIVSITLSGGETVAGKQFIDATYTGDLMAAAEVSYTVGREGRDQYGESYAGKQFVSGAALLGKDSQGGKQFIGGKPRIFEVNPRDEEGNLLPFVNNDELGDPEAGDHKIMNYNFRVTLTNDPDNFVPIPEPEHYDPSEFELLRRFFARYPDDGLVKRYGLPNNKFDCNDSQSQGFAIGLPGGSWNYPDADYETRRKIEKEHKEYTLGYFHFIRTDPSVPAHIRDDFAQFGLPKDEHVDTGNFPSMIYIREARRMLGGYVLTQKDMLEEPPHQDSIGVGLGPITIHNVQRIATENGYYHEGTVHTPYEPHGKPYLIPYRSLLPKKAECENLLVPVCLSASHVAMGSIRVEPTWIVLGQSAGIASALAAKDGLAVQELPYPALRKRLLVQAQVLDLVK